MNDLLNELEALLAKSNAVSPGPWSNWRDWDDHGIWDSKEDRVAGNYEYEEGGIIEKEDRDLIIALRNAAPALIARIRELEAAQTWMPIESAPKDGAKVLLYGGDVNPWQTCGWWFKDFSSKWNPETEEDEYFAAWTDGRVADWALEEYVELSPTHWQPLPDPPQL